MVTYRLDRTLIELERPLKLRAFLVLEIHRGLTLAGSLVLVPYVFLSFEYGVMAESIQINTLLIEKSQTRKKHDMDTPNKAVVCEARGERTSRI